MEIETIQKIQEIAAYTLLYSVMSAIVAFCLAKTFVVIYSSLRERGANVQMMLFWIATNNKRRELYINNFRNVVIELRKNEDVEMLKKMEDIFKRYNPKESDQ